MENVFDTGQSVEDKKTGHLFGESKVKFKPGQLLKISGATGSDEWGMFIVLENISDDKIKLWTICAPEEWSNALSRQTFDFEPQHWLRRKEGETIEIVSDETSSFNKTPKENK